MEARTGEHERCGTGDVVLVGTMPPQIGHVCLLFSLDGRALALLKQWDVVSDGVRAWKCRNSDRLACCEVDLIEHALIYGGAASDVKTVLKPWRA